MRTAELSLAITMLASFAHGQTACAASTFQNITLYGGQILSVNATSLTNVSAVLPTFTNFYPANVTGLNVCQVVVTYTHPGTNDRVNVTQFLPTQWNGRFMGIGGGGFSTGTGALGLILPASKGFSCATTDGGHAPEVLNASSWAWTSEGNVNYNSLQNFAAVALNDMATLGKAMTRAFYGTPANYSYWNGCSTGGRQGHMMAQRYPAQFDGIIATAPAINWEKFIVAELWPTQFMNLIKQYPRPCELQAITRAAIAACDTLDGVQDNVISLPNQCKFDALSVVNQTINCTGTGTMLQISSAAARVMNQFWSGATTVDGKFEWYGFSKDADASVLANTTCSSNGTCRAVPWLLNSEWLRLFVLKNSTIDLTTLTHPQYDYAFRQANNIYKSVIGTSDSDLTDFRNRGGKMLMFHGLADQLIMPNGTVDYYRRVLELDPKAADYYRYFPAPGVYHCSGGPGWYPGDIVQATIDWVEKGVVPDTLAARSVFSTTNTNRTANLCAYPKVLTYRGGDSSVASSYTCQ